MASPNRHWPSMFRSNLACNIQQQQQQHHPDMNGNGSSSPSFLLSPPPASSGKPSLISSGCEEGTRNPEPAKPRWNPRPEQIRILEGIFNSGMVNPPRDEIRRIRLQLQEFGHVADANVFYWFQNRKSRTKNKLRAAAGHLHHHGRAALARAPAPAPPVTPPRRHLLAAAAAPGTGSSSSSSCDRSSGSSNNKSVKPATAAMAIDLFSSAAAAPPAQLYYHHSHPTQLPATPPAGDQMIASPESSSLLMQWPAAAAAAASQYMPATELGGVLGSHMNNTPAISPAAGVLLGLCNEAAALGQHQQQEIMDHSDMISCSKSKGFGHYMDMNTSTELSSKIDAMSAVIRDDEMARLGLLHYAAANPAPHHHHHHQQQQQQHRHLACPVHAVVDAAEASTATLPFTTAATTTNSALADQLQGLLDAGLLQGGGGAAAPLPSATVVVVSRDAVTMCVKTTSYSFPAMMHLSVKMFGEAAVLVRNSGETVLVDDSGVTVEPLQHGAIYYVLLATEDAVQWTN